MTFVTIDGLLIGDGSTVEQLYTLTENGITGWRGGGVDFRRERTPRPARHGEFPSRGYKSGRLVRVEFEVLTPPSSGRSHVEAIDRALAVLDDGGDGELRIDDGDRELIATASRYGEPEVTTVVEDLLSVVAMRFLTPDPRRYSDEVQFPAASSLQLFHRGNSTTLPELRVVGPSAGGYTLTFSTGDFVTVPGGLAAGAVDVLSAGTQWVKRAGATTPLLGVTGHVPELPPGVTVTVTVAGATSVAATIRDAFT